MVRLVTEDAPDVVALQEVPLWALSRLGGWSRMRSFAAVTKRALLGPSARRLHAFDPVHVRSALTGQANALLVGSRVEALGGPRTILLNPGSRGERRVCQLLRTRAGERELVVGNLHASTRAEAAARGELELVGALVAGEHACVVCGDFNVRSVGLRGFSAPLAGIDQIVVRGLALLAGPAPWPENRRTVDGLRLSDHAPVEAVVA